MAESLDRLVPTSIIYGFILVLISTTSNFNRQIRKVHAHVAGTRCAVVGQRGLVWRYARAFSTVIVVIGIITVDSEVL